MINLHGQNIYSFQFSQIIPLSGSFIYHLKKLLKIQKMI